MLDGTSGKLIRGMTVENAPVEPGFWPVKCDVLVFVVAAALIVGFLAGLYFGGRKCS